MARDDLTESLPERNTIIGDGNVIGNDNIVTIVKQVFEPLPRPVDAEMLAKAQARLAALPLDTIPDPAPLPAGSRMPFGHNPLFVGREADLRALAAALKAGETAAIGQVQIAAATGLGGIGKTQLASEFVHRYGQFFVGGVFWLSFADPNAVPAEIGSCGGLTHLNLRPDFGELALNEQVELVLAAWQSSLPRLLIFDNCEDPELLARWRPRAGGAQVLVTSRRAEWEAALGVTALPLGVLNRAESIVLLRKHRPDLRPDDADLVSIAEELGDLPLALHLAGSYLARYRHAFTPFAYLAQLRQPGLLQHRSLQGGGFSPTGHAGHVARTFALSHEKLDPADLTDELALSLLARAAYLAPGEPIPRDLLQATLGFPEDNPEAAIQTENALARLEALGLLESEAEGALRLHRLVAAFVQEAAANIDMPGVATGSTARISVANTLLIEARRLNNVGNPAPLLAWQVHLRAVTDAALIQEDERAAGLCNELGRHLRMSGDLPGARLCLERALAVRKQILGDEHPDTAESLNNLGWLLRQQGDYEKAWMYLEQALSIRREVLGDEHPDTAESFNNVGAVLQAQGDLTGARLYREQALAIRLKVLGENHPDTAYSLSTMSYLLKAEGDLARAQQYDERALAIRLNMLGEDHPETAQSLNNLGYVLRTRGDLVGARHYYERALAVREKVLGSEHPDVANSLNNLGMLLKAMGDLAGARSYLERALTIRARTLGEGHPDTARSLSNLGRLLQAQGDLAGARPYLEQALSIRRKVLGDDHPDTAKSLSNLALLSQAQGKLDEARSHFERALAIYERVLPPEHPKTRMLRETLRVL